MNRGCGCRSENKMCDTNRCACRKGHNICSGSCSCVERKCKNRGEPEAPKVFAFVSRRRQNRFFIIGSIFQENLNTTYTKEEELDDFSENFENAENAIGTSKMLLSYTQGTEEFRKKALTPYRREGKLFGSISLTQPILESPPKFQNNEME